MKRSGAAILTLDLGNTTLDCLWTRGEERDRARLDANADALRAWLAGRPVDEVGACSVTTADLGFVREVCGREPRLAGTDLPCPLRSDYPDPSTLGVDRWVACVAARERFGDAVIVDCGTAFTIDLVSADGRHHGGAIGLGLGGIGRALAAAAPALPVFDGQPPHALPAVDSPDAVRAGVGAAFGHAIRGLVEDCVARAGLGAARRVLTGGDAETVQRLLDPEWVVEPDLVHQGLRLLLGSPPA